MTRARQAAMELRRRHGIDGLMDEELLDRVAGAERLEIEEGWPLRGRVREVYCAGMLAIRGGLEAGWVFWLKAHGLGHHLLHRGNHLYVRDGLHLWQRHEMEAELFAGTLLLGAARPLTDLAMLSATAGVPRECVLSWQTACLLVDEEARRLAQAPHL